MKLFNIFWSRPNKLQHILTFAYCNMYLSLLVRFQANYVREYFRKLQTLSSWILSIWSPRIMYNLFPDLCVNRREGGGETHMLGYRSRGCFINPFACLWGMPPCGDAVVTLVHSHCVGILRPLVAGGSRQWGGDAVRSSSGCVDVHGGWVDAHRGWKRWPITVPVAHKAPCTCIEGGSCMTRCAGRCESGVTHHVHSTGVPRGPSLTLGRRMCTEWVTHNTVQVAVAVVNPGTYKFWPIHI